MFAGQLKSPRRRWPGLTPKLEARESEVMRHTGARPDHDTAAVRQCSPLALLHSQLDRVSRRACQHPSRATRISRQLSFKHSATTTDVVFIHRMEPSVVVINFCLFLLASSTSSSSGNTADAVFLPLAVSHCSLSRSRSSTSCRRNRPGWARD